MMRKAVSSILAVVMLCCSSILAPFAVYAEETPERDIESVADPETSDSFANFFAKYLGQNVFWSDKSVADNGDGTMNVTLSAMVQKVAQEEGVITEPAEEDESEGEGGEGPSEPTEPEDLGPVLDETGVTVFTDSLGDGFFIDGDRNVFGRLFVIIGFRRGDSHFGCSRFFDGQFTGSGIYIDNIITFFDSV